MESPLLFLRLQHRHQCNLHLTILTNRVTQITIVIIPNISSINQPSKCLSNSMILKNVISHKIISVFV